MNKLQLEKAFYPTSIAVIGSSRDPAKLGHMAVKSLVKGGFKGKIYPVNIKGGKILGLKAYRSVIEIPDEVDLAVIAVPEKFVLGAIKECAEKGVKCAVIYSAGFGEIKDGLKLEQELVSTARESGVRIIGPNTNGIFNRRIKLNATFNPNINYKEGSVAFVCQSGGYSGSLLSYGSREGVGVGKFVNLGNSCDLGFAHLITYLGSDDFTKVIILYIEGLKHENEGRRFLEAAKEVTKIKPIIAFKAGKTEAGQRAVRSHTGSLAGSDELFDAAFKQAGIIRAIDGMEMFDVAKSFIFQPPLPQGNKIVILTNLGGPGVVAADVCESRGLKLSELSKVTKKKLSEILSVTASFANPVDLAKDWPRVELYRKVLSILFEDEEVNGAIVIFHISPILKFRGLIKDIIEVSKEYNKPIVTCCLSSEELPPECEELGEHKIPYYTMPEKAAKAMVGLVKYSMYLRKLGGKVKK